MERLVVITQLKEKESFNLNDYEITDLSSFIWNVGILAVAKATYPDLDIDTAVNMVRQEATSNFSKLAGPAILPSTSTSTCGSCGGGEVR